MSLLLVIIGAFSIVIVRKNRDISRRNLALAAQVKAHLADRKELDRKISENLALRDRLEHATAELAATMARSVSVNTPEGKMPVPKESVDQPAEADRILFERIICEIKDRQLFRDPDFSRTEMLRIIPVPQNKFAGLFKQFAGMPFTTYVPNLRLEYANELFIEHPNWTTDAVIKECGMQRSTFYASFMRKFGVNPDEFRKSLQKEQKSDYSVNN